MMARSYRASLIVALLYAAPLLAGCNGGSAAPNVPAGSPLQNPAQPPLHFRFHRDVSAVKIWGAMPLASYVLGMSGGGKEIVAAINTATQSVPGLYPVGLKVDHNQNLWVADYFGGGYGNGVIQEYTGGSFANAYQTGCPASSSNCSNFAGYVSDVAVNSGYVFAIMEFISYQIGTSNFCCTGYEYWPIGDPSAMPGAVVFTNPCGSGGLCELTRGDVDGAGNLWALSVGVNGGPAADGLSEITNPTTSPSYSQVEPFGTYSFQGGAWSDTGGVYVSNAGTVLNVADANADKIYQYAVPLSPSGEPFNTLTPCILKCEPEGFGFTRNDKQVVAGDGSSSPSEGWLDIGKVSTNQWKQVANPQFAYPFAYAVYTPSDK